MGDEEIPLAREATSHVSHTSQVSITSIKLRYGGIMLLVFLVAFIFRAAPAANKAFKEIGAIHGECRKGDDTEYCMSLTFTMRLAFSLFCFFVLHFIMSLKWMRLCFGDYAFSVLIAGGFLWKLLLLAGLIVGSLFIPFNFFVGFSWVAMVCAVLFLMMQAVILLDFAYSWNERWVPRDGWGDDSEATMFKRATVIATFLLFAAGCTLIGLSYKWFAPDGCTGSDRSLHLFFITFTLIFGILSTLGSAAIDGGSILISSFAFAYCAVITFSALNSGSSEECNDIWSDPTKISFNTVLSMLIAVGAVIIASMSSSSQRSTFVVNDEVRDADDEDDGSSFPFFFLCYAFGACYLAMTLSGWSIMKGASDVPGHDNYVTTDLSTPTMWVKISTVWFTMILFVWALIAPRVCGQEGFCCQDREF